MRKIYVKVPHTNSLLLLQIQTVKILTANSLRDRQARDLDLV